MFYRLIKTLFFLIVAVSVSGKDLFVGSGDFDRKDASILFNFGEFNAILSEQNVDGYKKVEAQKRDGDYYIISHHSGYKFDLEHEGYITGNGFQKLLILNDKEVEELEAEGLEVYKPQFIETTPTENGSLEKLPVELPKMEFIDEMVDLVDRDRLEENLQALEDMGTRYFLHPNRREVSQWIVDRFLEYGAEDAYLDSFWLQTGGGSWQYNAIAEIEGSENSERTIVLGGHHDSIVGNVPGTQGQDPMQLAPGTDDNSTAVACALEMVKTMSDYNYTPKHTIKLATFAAEEVGLWGSKDMAAKAFNNSENIKLYINNDMIAHNTQSSPDWGIRVMPYSNSLGEAVITAEVSQEYSDLNIVYGGMNSSGSDSRSFFDKGYNCVYFFEKEFTPHYHSYNDLLINCDLDYYKEAVKANLATLLYFDNNPEKCGDFSCS